jgi:hypothetical protein
MILIRLNNYCPMTVMFFYNNKIVLNESSRHNTNSIIGKTKLNISTRYHIFAVVIMVVIVW